MKVSIINRTGGTLFNRRYMLGAPVKYPNPKLLTPENSLVYLYSQHKFIKTILAQINVSQWCIHLQHLPPKNSVAL